MLRYPFVTSKRWQAGMRRSRVTDPWRRIRVEALEPRRVLSGIFLVTHGFNSSADGWVAEMANAVESHPGLNIEQPRYRVEVTDPGRDGNLLVTSTASGPVPDDAATTDAEIAILLDWSDVAGTLTFGGGYHRSTPEVAAAVVQALVSPGFLSGLSSPAASVPFHLLGHSRGASLVGELARELGELGIWVDQVTTWDPHPVDRIREPWLFNLDFGDPAMAAWENVEYWDNYWRTDGSRSFDFTGEPITGTYDLQLNESILANGGYSNEHSDVHLWYYGTIDTSTNPPANNGDKDVPNSWYGAPHPERDATGFIYSRLIGGQREPEGLYDQAVGRVSVDTANAVWPNVMQLNVAPGYSQFVIGQDTIPASFFYQYGQDSSVTFHLDGDKNPFNDHNPQAIDQIATLATTSTPVPVATDVELSSGTLLPGDYYLAAQINGNGGQTRYAYTASPITLVTGANDPPVAFADVFDTNEDTPIDITLTGSDSDGDPLTYAVVSGPARGTLSGAAPDLIYTPNLNFHGNDSFTFVINDGFVDSSPATISITVDAVNDVPVANDQSISTNEDTPIDITLTGSDSDSDPLTYTILIGPAHGTLSGAAPNLTYTPVPGFSGGDSVEFIVNDGFVDSSPATVSVTVTGVNAPPVANDQSTSTNEDTPIDITLTGSDSDGDPLTYAVFSGPAHGTLSGAAPDLTYTPNLNFHGNDSFTFVVNDGFVDSGTATISITVDAVNDVPVANDQSISTNEDTPIDITLTGSDSDSDPLTYTILIGPAHGTLGGAAPNLTYTPVLGFSGADSVEFIVNDGFVDSSAATVSITVTAVSAGPNLSHGVILNVGSNWRTVTLPHSYNSMVVVATPNYDSGSAPAVARIRNATGNSFDVRVDPAGGALLGNMDVHYVVVEEGLYDDPGCKLEAVTYLSTKTDENNSWIGESRSYQQSYTAPVVVGQVMTYNDPEWSVFWAAGGRRSSPPSRTALTVGKHVGEDPDVSRANETIGYVVIETDISGTAEINGSRYVAAVGADIVRGIGNSPPYSYGYSMTFNPQTAVVSQSGMDGGNGGWAVLYGDSPLTPGLELAIEEDQRSDSERRHTSEQVAYLIFDQPQGGTAAAIAPYVDHQLTFAGLDFLESHRTDSDQLADSRKSTWEVSPAQRRCVDLMSHAELPRPLASLRALDEFFAIRLERDEWLPDDLLEALA